MKAQHQDICFESVESAELEKIDTIISRYGFDKSLLIAIMQDAQAEYGYLPKPVLRRISERLHVPYVQVLGAATFFKAFRLTPRGKNLIHVCLGTACHVRGAPRILEEIKRELSIETGGTSRDGLFTLETVNCLGCCALGPVVQINNDFFGRMNASDIIRLIRKYANK